MKIAEISLILRKTFYCSYFVAMLQIITATFSILLNCYYMGKYKNLKVLPAPYRIQSNASISTFFNLLKDAISCISLEMILLEGRGT